MSGAHDHGRRRALIGFVVFGAFWGGWGAALPAVARRAETTQGELGLALLCVGAGALASMRPTGGLIDRFGRRVLPATLTAFAAAAAVIAMATSPVALAGALLLLGAASGAVDVAINAEASGVERTGRPLMSLAHAGFSGAVVITSLLVGAARSAGAGAAAVLGALAALVLLAAAVAGRMPAAPQPPSGVRRPPLLPIPSPLLILGALAALAYVVENAWQSWSAVQLEDTLGASPALAALGPATFGAAATLGRLIAHAVTDRTPARGRLALGAAIGAAGSLLAALASEPAVALAGIAVAGLGTSVCAPTLLSLAGLQAPAGERGAAIGTVTTLAYFGFLVGPAAVGLAAGAIGLDGALVCVAGVAALLAVAARAAPTPAAAPAPAIQRAGSGAP